MNILIERFGELFKGLISGFDRIVFKGMFSSLSHPVDYGFMNIRIQTWFPFHIQICLNGREWMRRSLQKAGIGFVMRGNKLLHAEDYEIVQRTLDLQPRARWAELLDGFLPEAFPTMRQTLGDSLSYRWTLWQSEWATDFICDSPARLNAISESLLRHAFITGTPERILRYLNRPLDAEGLPRVHLDDQVSSRALKFPDGLRVRHWLGSNSVKGYNELNVFRVETTVNHPAAFRVHRRAQGEPETAVKKLRPLRKGVADAALRAEVSQEVNDRFIQNLAAMADSTPVKELLAPVIKADAKNGRRVRALEPTGKDLEPFSALADPAFDLTGVTNKQLRGKLKTGAWADGMTDRQLSAKVSRMLRLLRDHGVLRKNPHRRSYHLTQRGRKIVIAVNAMMFASTEKLIELAA